MQNDMNFEHDHGKALCECRCGHEGFCVPLRKYRNGTLHAHGACPQCGNAGPHRQIGGEACLAEIDWLLRGLKSKIEKMKGLDRDEGIARLERLAHELHEKLKEKDK